MLLEEHKAMKKRNYIVSVSSRGEEVTELYYTYEVIITLIIANFKKDFEILKIERGEFFD